MYAVSVYVFFLVALVYSAGFFAGVGVPKSIDDGPRTPVPVAVGVDLLLLTLFAAQHTVMARPWFKTRWTRIVAPAAERATFVLAASVVMTLLFWLWRPIGATVWQVSGPPAMGFRVAYATGWALAIGSTCLISHSDLFGLRQAWLHLRRAGYEPPPFSERGLYRHVRHPLMAGFLLVFWSTPDMSARSPALRRRLDRIHPGGHRVRGTRPHPRTRRPATAGTGLGCRHSSRTDDRSGSPERRRP